MGTIREHAPLTDPAASAREPLIVVLDDEAAIVGELVDSLNHEGLRAIGVTQPAEALRHLASNAALRVLVTDIRMPGTDGVSLVRDLKRQRGEADAVEVVMITGHGSMDDAVAALRLGVVDFLNKPFRVADLHTACLSALNRAAQRRDAARAPQAAVATSSEMAPITDRDYLRAAIARDEIIPWLQPLVQVPNRALYGFEALARWHHPQRGLLPAGQFIPEVMAYGLSPELDISIMRQALRTVSAWRRAGAMPGALHVNLSPASLREPTLILQIKDLLQTEAAAPADLVIEVTEESAIADGGAQMLLRLADLGITLALDDFGTGFSSLSRLIDLPVRMIKLDRSFLRVSGIAAGSLIADVTSFARGRGLRVLAEGLETHTHWEMSVRAGVDLAQGWLTGIPLPLDQAERVAAGLMAPSTTPRA
jgi:EAL domain-containing protein (putative c-di-GMP-specific phosphodiesterase class I)/FixJ family two-component response regulator